MTDTVATDALFGAGIQSRLDQLLQAGLRSDGSAWPGYDIAKANLVCAEGLPGSEDLDIEHCLATIDLWSEFVAEYTRRSLPNYLARPQGSYPYLLVLAMITALQKHIGVRYAPELMPKCPDELSNWPFDDSRRVFLHGIIQGNGGSCASLPVLYVAVGRRLGYPLHIVPCKGHLFARWDDPNGERFNIEASGRGLLVESDEYFRTGRHQSTDEQISDYHWLKSLTARDEVGMFFCDRANCWYDCKKYREAAADYAHGWQLMPENFAPRDGFYCTCKRWKERIQAMAPPHSPRIDIYFPPRRFPGIPEELEQEIIALEEFEELLSDPEKDRTWWEPLRRCDGVRPPDVPRNITVRFQR